MLSMIPALVLASGLSVATFDEPEFENTQVQIAQSDVTSADVETEEVEYIEWTFL